MQDDFIVLHSSDGYDSLLETVFKTEVLTCLTKSYKAKLGNDLRVTFSDRCVIMSDILRQVRYYITLP